MPPPVGGVDDVQQEVGVGGDLKRRGEGFHELVGQLADESHGVGAQHALAAGELEAACGGIECREEAVLDEHASIGQPIEKGGLPCVRVTDDRNPLEA